MLETPLLEVSQIKEILYITMRLERQRYIQNQTRTQNVWMNWRMDSRFLTAFVQINEYV